MPLFTGDEGPTRPCKPRPEPLGKIGVLSETRAILGNRDESFRPAQPDDLYRLAQATAQHKANIKAEQDYLLECKRRAHAKRQLQVLELEVAEMRASSTQKERDMARLRAEFGDTLS